MLDPRNRNLPQGVPLALEFAEALVAGKYYKGHAMLSGALRAELSIAQLQQQMQAIFAGSDRPPTKATVLTAGWAEEYEGDPTDLGWALISIRGEGWNHFPNITVHVMKQHTEQVIRRINWTGGFG